MTFSMSRVPSLISSHPRERHLRWASSKSKTHRFFKMPFRHPLFHVLAIICVVLSSAILNHGKSANAVQGGAAVCVTYDHPNPLAEVFPNNATGVLNATLAIIPIPLDVARGLIPPQYGILESAYRALLPNFPEGMYPVMLQAAHDHDIQFRAYGITLDDFSRVGFEFPFLDLLGDGYSSFRWAPEQLITETNTIAVEGSRAYGTKVSPAEYKPLCEPYMALANGATYFKGSSLTTSEFIELEMRRFSGGAGVLSNPYPLELFKNITNQPTFANATTCDNMIRLFNTSMAMGEHAPAPVVGRIRANAFPFTGQEVEWTDVYGVQVATPFIENNYLDCRTMKGYDGTGGPDDAFIQQHTTTYNDNEL
ncbi:hypothetical protein B0H66DRAFT_144501 [Apodospora peruviana]|uniref:Uncharacterized protein n=1 Tax=Apodospora peruviana TaxID=516989 RepID=A0AAE0IJA2_9PEZI|nr:hypothetical protein B0H66DRAFT_144501 [Apodospora peruviana]